MSWEWAGVTARQAVIGQAGRPRSEQRLVARHLAFSCGMKFRCLGRSLPLPLPPHHTVETQPELVGCL